MKRHFRIVSVFISVLYDESSNLEPRHRSSLVSSVILKSSKGLQDHQVLQPQIYQHHPIELSEVVDTACGCVVQRSSHWPCAALEHLRCGQCDRGTEPFILIALDLNSHLH